MKKYDRRSLPDNAEATQYMLNELKKRPGTRPFARSLELAIKEYGSLTRYQLEALDHMYTSL